MWVPLPPDQLNLAMRLQRNPVLRVICVFFLLRRHRSFPLPSSGSRTGSGFSAPKSVKRSYTQVRKWAFATPTDPPSIRGMGGSSHNRPDGSFSDWLKGNRRENRHVGVPLC